MTTAFFNTFYKKGMDGDVDLLVDTIKAMLLTNATEPDIDADEFVSDLPATEVSGGGYARKTLGTKTTTVDDTNDRAAFDCADIDWSADSFTTARYMVIFKDTGADATSPVICYFDFTTDKTAPKVQPSANGLFAHGKV